MSPSVLADAFGHHTWATARILDACADLAPEQLEASVPGTYGSIIGTLRHIVGADAGYLDLLTDGGIPDIDEESGIGLAELREANERHAAAWAELVDGEYDPGADIVRHRDDGTDSHAPMGIRLVQAVQHGTDHRSQVCTALTSLGIEPPEIDVWAYAEKDGRISVTPAPPG
jgi:uncharacterized damage-inducible protein DinB